MGDFVDASVLNEDVIKYGLLIAEAKSGRTGYVFTGKINAEVHVKELAAFLASVDPKYHCIIKNDKTFALKMQENSFLAYHDKKQGEIDDAHSPAQPSPPAAPFKKRPLRQQPLVAPNIMLLLASVILALIFAFFFVKVGAFVKWLDTVLN